MQHAADQHEFEEEGRRACGPGCELVTNRCACGLGQRLRVLDGRIVGVEVQIRSSWQWFDPLELLSTMPYALCPECGGNGTRIGCLSCLSLGVLEIGPGIRHAGVAR